MTRARPILVKGRNCWRQAHADRVALLIDGDAYFRALAGALERAERSVLILSWDIDSRLRLIAEEEASDLPRHLGGFMKALLERRPKLHVHVLNWDFPLLYALGREPFPLLNSHWHTHRRMHYHLDACHPRGACHHQKVVVVDDRVAFVGGFDLTAHRWDLPRHQPQDPRRIDASGEPYGPFHDVQMAVDGPAAAALGDLVRERWLAATGRRLSPPGVGGDRWPDDLPADLEDVEVAIARTLPAGRRQPAVREVERLWLDAFGAARRWIFVESQYFTAAGPLKRLAARLQEEDGPEVVVVGPREAAGWLEQATMGVLRSRNLKLLRSADRWGRLRTYYPEIPGLRGSVLLHSKVVVVDDRLLKVGSSNLNNRSMGLDTECDLAIESGGAARVERGIARFRARLLGEHLDVPREAVEEALGERGSLIGAVEALAGRPRTLRPLQGEVPEWMDAMVPEGALFDPERPIYDERLIRELIPGEAEGSRLRPAIFLSVVLLLLAGLAIAWNWTPLARWADPQLLLEWGETLRQHPLAPLLVVGAFILGGLLVFPVSVLTLATGLIFGWKLGFFYALGGLLGSAMCTYLLGRLLGKETLQRLGGNRLKRLTLRVSRHGLLAVVAVRIIPMAPFTVVNLMAGASRITARDYLLGTFLGLLPGTLLFVIFGDALSAALREVHLLTILVLLAIPAGLALLGFWIVRLLRRRAAGSSRLESGS